MDYDDFESWYAACDRACIAIAGLGIDDLTDGPSHDSWESGMTPQEYVEERLAEDGFPMELLYD